MKVREAHAFDAHGMSKVLQELIATGQRTKSGDADFVLSHYIEHPDRIRCSIACDEEKGIVGFQSLKIAARGNPYGTPVGWGIIGTHVRPSAARCGVATALFAQSFKAARERGLPSIEAFIGEQNSAALAYYERMGFRTYRQGEGVICKAFHLVDRDER